VENNPANVTTENLVKAPAKYAQAKGNAKQNANILYLFFLTLENLDL
jgi:hypothetical protein